jgi:hypothetical protein
MYTYYRNKYGNRKIEYEGKVFDSKREAMRYKELLFLLRAGEIHDLQTQVKFTLIPTQRRNGKVVERECAYYADFVYRDKNGNKVVEDTKGLRTKDYVIKRKLMLFVHDIEIQEV